MKTCTSPVLTLDTTLCPQLEETYAWQDGAEAPNDRGLRMDWVCYEDAIRLFPKLEGVERIVLKASTHPPADPKQACYYFKLDFCLYFQQVLDAGSWELIARHYRLNKWLQKVVREFDSRFFYGWIEEVK